MRSHLASLLAVLLLATFATGASAAGFACALQLNQLAACASSEQSCPEDGVRDDCATVCAQMCSGLAAAVPALPEMPTRQARFEASVAPILTAIFTRPDPPPPRG